MEPLLWIVIAVVVVVVIVIAIRRGRGAEKHIELPPSPQPGLEPPSETKAEADTRRTSEPAPPIATTGSERPIVEPPPGLGLGLGAAPSRPLSEESLPIGFQMPKPPKPVAPAPDEIAALRKGLASTRGGFIARLAKIFGRKKEIDPALLDEIEEVLITADIGVKTTHKILERLRERMSRNELSDADRVWEAIRDEARTILGGSKGGVVLSHKPTVILVVGVNGVGKTTTIGKLASRFHEEGKKVILAAGDTFRAAAVLQLEVWGRRVGCQVVKGKDNADPGSVIFDAIKKAKEEQADVVIADTAGRLHTKLPLMEELKKVSRTVEKALERRPDETLLVLDSTNGQNAIQQAQMFRDALAVSGIVLTKLDGTAKGGVILGIVDEHQIPVRYIGIGERVEDLKEFDADSFVEALFAKPDDESMAA